MPRHGVFTDIDIRLATERQRAFLGSAKVKIDHIDIGSQSELSTEKIEALNRVFWKVGLNRYSQENHVDVLISRATLERALEQRGLSANELCQQRPAEYPELDFSSTPLRCLHGKYRLQAARSLPPKEQWWIVDLYLDEVSEELRRKRSENHYHESLPATGEIYIKGRWYEEQGDKTSANRWWARLSNCEEERLVMLKKHPQLWEAFDSLRKIPAIVLSGALLSVWNKLLALHCDEELIDYLTKIRMFWESIAMNDASKMRRITCEDVKALQGLAPGASSVDRTEVSKLVLGRVLFSEYSQAERQCIYEKLVSHKGRIPSLRLFFEDVNFLAIGASRIKELLDPGKLWQSDRFRAVQRTVRETMEFMFEHSRGDINIQTSNTSSRQITCDVDTQFDLAYRQVWLGALRFSSGRPSKGNRHTTLDATTQPYDQYQVALLASQLGFRSPRISEALRSPLEPEARPWHDFDDDRLPVLKRQGVPYVVTFRDDREFLFLDRVHGPLDEGQRLTSAFVLRDIYLAFFGVLTVPLLNHGQHDAQSTTGSGSGHTREHNISNDLPRDESQPEQAPEASSGQTPHSIPPNRPSGFNDNAEPVDRHRMQSPTLPPTRSPQPQTQVSAELPGATTSNNVEGSETEIGASAADEYAPASEMDCSSIEDLEQQLCNQREQLLGRQNRMQDFSRTIQEQVTIIYGLQPQERLAESVVDEILRETTKDLNNHMTTRRQILEEISLRIRSSLSAVEEKIRQLGFLLQKGGTTEGSSLEIIEQAHVVCDSIKSDCPNLDGLATEMETMLWSLWVEIRSLQAFLLASGLGHVIGKISSCSSRVVNLNHIATTLGEGLSFTDIEKKDYASNLKFIQTMQSELATMQDRLQKQRDTVTNVNVEMSESLWQDLLKTSSELEVSTNQILSTLPDKIAEGEHNIQELYISRALIALREAETLLGAEQDTIDRLSQRHGAVQNQSRMFENALSSHEFLLYEGLSIENQSRISQYLDTIKESTAEDLINDVLVVHQVSRAELEKIQPALRQPLRIEMLLHNQTVLKKVQKDVEVRRKGCMDLEGQLHDRELLVIEALQQTVSILASEVERLSSEASRQATFASHTEDNKAAKLAIEASQQALREMARLVRLMQELQSLAEDTAPSIREDIGKKVAEAQQVSQDANTATSSAASAVRQATNALTVKTLCEEARQGCKEAKKLCQSWKQDQGAGADQTLRREYIEKMQAIAAKPLNNITMVQARLQDAADNTISVSLLEDALKSATATCGKTTDFALALYKAMVRSTVRACGEERSKLCRERSGAIDAIGTQDYDKWGDHVDQTKMIMRDMQNCIETTKQAHSAAAQLESAASAADVKGAISENGLLILNEIKKGVEAVSRIQVEANLEMKEVESSWRKASTEEIRQRALDECQNARESLNNIPEERTTQRDGLAAVEACQDAEEQLATIEEAWESRRLPDSELEHFANQFGTVLEKAARARGIIERLLELGLDASEKVGTATTSHTEKIHRSDGSQTWGTANGVREVAEPEKELEQTHLDMQLQAQKAIDLSTCVTNLYVECEATDSLSNKNKTEFNRNIEQIEGFAVETHGIYQDIRSRTIPHSRATEAVLKEVEKGFLVATNDAFRFCGSLIKKLSASVSESNAEIKEQQNLSHKAVGDNDKEKWESCRTCSQTIMENMNQDVLLAEKGEGAAKRVRDSFLRHRELSTDALQTLDTIAREVDAIKQIGNEAGSETMIGWWNAKAKYNSVRTQNLFDQADANFRSLALSKAPDYKHAKLAHKLAKDAYEEAKQKWLSCTGPEEEYRKIDEELDNVCRLAMASTKASETVGQRKGMDEKGERAKARMRDEDVIESETAYSRGDMQGKRRKLDRTHKKVIQLYVIQPGFWDLESHVILPTDSFRKGQELGKRGRLCVLNPETTRLGYVTADCFENKITDGERLFFLEQSHSLTSEEVLSRACELYHNLSREEIPQSEDILDE